MLGDNFKYRYISAETWRKTNKDFKTVINGVKYKMFLDESRGTILAPVKIRKES
jgi:N6-adenosine-specific RNA methylase IME4